MKTIGREVHYLPISKGNSRNGEGAFLRLQDGGIMFAYTHFKSDNVADEAIACICACYSYDEGETWSESRVIKEKDEDAENIMLANLYRMNNGDIGLIHGRKVFMPDGGIVTIPHLARSSDEGRTFSSSVSFGLEPAYYCQCNDDLLRLRSGRLLKPVQYCGLRYDPHGVCNLPREKNASIRFIYSDDDGAHWDMLPAIIRTPYSDSSGFMEPGIYEHEDGTLWCWFRTNYGYQYHSHSFDGGITWTDPEPNFFFTSPNSPMRVKRIGEYAVAVFNPLSFNCVRTDTEIFGAPKRTPLICAISHDDARSFDSTGKTAVGPEAQAFARNCYYLEADTTKSYCYPALLEIEGGFLAAYYDSAGYEFALSCTRITKVSFDELD